MITKAFAKNILSDGPRNASHFFFFFSFLFFSYLLPSPPPSSFISLSPTHSSLIYSRTPHYPLSFCCISATRKIQFFLIFLFFFRVFRLSLILILLPISSIKADIEPTISAEAQAQEAQLAIKHGRVIKVCVLRSLFFLSCESCAKPIWMSVRVFNLRRARVCVCVGGGWMLFWHPMALAAVFWMAESPRRTRLLTNPPPHSPLTCVAGSWPHRFAWCRDSGPHRVPRRQHPSGSSNSKWLRCRWALVGWLAGCIGFSGIGDLELCLTLSPLLPFHTRTTITDHP